MGSASSLPACPEEAWEGEDSPPACAIGEVGDEESSETGSPADSVLAVEGALFGSSSVMSMAFSLPEDTSVVIVGVEAGVGRVAAVVEEEAARDSVSLDLVGFEDAVSASFINSSKSLPLFSVPVAAAVVPTEAVVVVGDAERDPLLAGVKAEPTFPDVARLPGEAGVDEGLETMGALHGACIGRGTPCGPTK
jgi:hypothetical protein